jgi:hypothetical protein
VSLNEEGRLICHVCGVAFEHLAHHVAAHNLWVWDHRAYFALEPTHALVSQRLRAIPDLRRKHKVCSVCGGEVPWQRRSTRTTCSDARLAARRAEVTAEMRSLKGPAKKPGQRFDPPCVYCGKPVIRRRPTRGIPRRAATNARKERQGTRRGFPGTRQAQMKHSEAQCSLRHCEGLLQVTRSRDSDAMTYIAA